MAGLGFKDFAVGEVLTSANVDGYLMQQTVMRFADAAARGSALGTATGTAVPLAEGMVSYLDDADDVQVFTGSAWTSVIGVRQVLSAVKADTFSTTSTSMTPVTGLSVSITPASTASKVLVMATVAGEFHAGSADFGALTVFRDATDLVVPTSPGSRVPSFAFFNMAGLQNGDQQMWSHSFVYLDSPATTSSVTYQVHGKVTGGNTLYVNRSTQDTDNGDHPRGVSTITVMEVVA